MSVLSVVNGDGTTANGSSLIDEIVREGQEGCWPRRWAEVNSHKAELADQRDEPG